MKKKIFYTGIFLIVFGVQLFAITQNYWESRQKKLNSRKKPLKKTSLIDDLIPALSSNLIKDDHEQHRAKILKKIFENNRFDFKGMYVMEDGIKIKRGPEHNLRFLDKDFNWMDSLTQKNHHQNASFLEMAKRYYTVESNPVSKDKQLLTGALEPLTNSTPCWHKLFFWR